MKAKFIIVLLFLTMTGLFPLQSSAQKKRILSPEECKKMPDGAAKSSAWVAIIKNYRDSSDNTESYPYRFNYDGVYLKDANLAGVQILDYYSFKGANLINADLTGAWIRGSNFSHANLKGANLKLTFWNKTNFQHADLTNANLTHTKFVTDNSDALDYGPDFSNAKLVRADLTGAKLKKAKFGNSDLRYAKLVAANLFRADLSGANMKGDFGLVQWNGTNLNGADLTNAILTGADLTAADLTKATLTGAKLTNAKLKGALLTGAEFKIYPNYVMHEIESQRRYTLSGAVLQPDPMRNFKREVMPILNGVDFSYAKLNGVNLGSADLGGANLSCTDLSQANLSNAKLTKARLNNADLKGANLSNADLKGADLTDADLKGAVLKNAKVDSLTKVNFSVWKNQGGIVLP